MRYFIALLLLAWPLAAAAQPRSIADCEKVKGDLAYNQCLASFGPPARSGAARSFAGEVDSSNEAQLQEPPRSGSIGRGRGSYNRQAESYGRKRGGRQSMSFDVVGNRSETRTSERARSNYHISRRRR